MDNQSAKYEAIKITGNKSTLIEDTVVVEAPLQININNEPYTVVMRTPGEDENLVRGLLYAEDIYKGKENIVFDVVENSPNNFTVLNATIPKNLLGKGYLNKRTLLSVSSCGVCGTQTLDAIQLEGKKLLNNSNLTSEAIELMFEKMNKNQELFNKTGSSHAACIFDVNQNFLSLAEDIGRHNALDKAIGQLLNTNKLNKAQFILMSSRVSYEIVSKAFIAKIPNIIAVSGCSSLAIDFAKEFGLNLIGFSRQDNRTQYSIKH